MRLEVSPSCSRGVRYLLVLYTVISLVLTVNHFYSSHGDRSILTQDTTPIFPRADGDELVIPNLDSSSQQQQQQSQPSPPPPHNFAAVTKQPVSKQDSQGNAVVFSYANKGIYIYICQFSDPVYCSCLLC